jgi:hypothetical protein
MSRRNFIKIAASAGLGTLAFTGGFPFAACAAKKRKLVAKVVPINGVLKLEINGEVFDPLSFRSFRPEVRNITDFHKVGIRLMSVLHTGLDCTLDVPYSPYGESWKGIGKYDFDAIDRQMDLFLSNAPDTYFNIMLQLDTRDWYLKLHPEYSNSYWNLVEMAGVKQWREDTARFLQDMLNYFENKYGDKVYSYSLFCGSSTEWYTNSQGRGRPEAAIREHPVKEASFREFTGNSSAKLIPLEQLHKTSHGVFRHPVNDAEALRYWRFHHQIIGDTIVYFAAKSQEVLHHKKLLGLFYGYLTQLDGKRLLEEGHLGYERVWACTDLDIIYAPAKYGKPRSFEGASGYLLTLDSLALHGKLMWQEIDHTTYVAPQTVENGRRIPGSDSKLNDEFQTRMVLRREFALTRTKRTALWWFDFFGGYYYSEALMNEVANMIKVQERIKDVPMRSVAEIAVFGDVESMYYAQAFSSLATDLLVTPPDALARIGAPYDIFNFCDLDHENLLIDQYKLIIFLNTFLISDEKKEFINKKVKANERTILWLYAPNYIQANGFSSEAIAHITDFGVNETNLENSEVIVKNGGLFAKLPANVKYAFTKVAVAAGSANSTVAPKSAIPVSPLFEIIDPKAEALGIYTQNSKVAFARKKLKNYTSVYSTVGNLTTDVYREIARAAGVHIYYEGKDPVYINNRLIGIHMQTDTEHIIKLPNNTSCRFEELFDGAEINSSDGKFHILHAMGEMKMYLLVDGDLAPNEIG